MQGQQKGNNDKISNEEDSLGREPKDDTGLDSAMKGTKRKLDTKDNENMDDMKKEKTIRTMLHYWRQTVIFSVEQQHDQIICCSQRYSCS